MNYSEIHEDLKWRYRRQKIDKIFNWIFFVIVTVSITGIVLALIYNHYYPVSAIKYNQSQQEMARMEQRHVEFEQAHPLVINAK